ncbi:mechanosensitive ion channel [Aerococcus sp. UMB1112A]|uniref:mechanosensitive ion channel family protein n=1 Tax=Aerococcus sp. UMB1112A TaxID=3050609 RepID=UPI00254B361D|nr:mechanosensitive ion channel domain-containing protein [Aerococcus sp. UMB1112A]MDK8502550.1 mechanosensitive ion channel [Aerococcus sp. UMB1112A]
MTHILKDWLDYLSAHGVGYWIAGLLSFLLLLALYFLCRKLLHRFNRDHSLSLLLQSILNWLASFVFIIFFISYFSQSRWFFNPLFKLGQTDVSTFLLFSVGFAILLAIRFVNGVKRFLLPSIFRRYDIDPGAQATITTLFTYIVLIAVVLVTLKQLNFDLTSLSVFAGVIGVGVGFGIRNIMNNFISGLIILFSRPIRVGDLIEVDETVATVEEIRIRETIVRTRRNERMLIPNSYFLENSFVNRSYGDPEIRVTVSVGIDYDSDLQLARQLLLQALKNVQAQYPEILDEPKARVFLTEFADSSINFELWFWLSQQNNEREQIITTEIHYEIFKLFEAGGIEFPYPRQDVRILNPMDNKTDKEHTSDDSQ